MMMRDGIVEGSRNCNHLMFFNKHQHCTDNKPLVLPPKRDCRGWDFITAEARLNCMKATYCCQFHTPHKVSLEILSKNFCGIFFFFWKRFASSFIIVIMYFTAFALAEDVVPFR